MAGDKWQEFLESVKTSGVIEPIVITQDCVIVSEQEQLVSSLDATKKYTQKEIAGYISQLRQKDQALSEMRGEVEFYFKCAFGGMQAISTVCGHK